MTIQKIMQNPLYINPQNFSSMEFEDDCFVCHIQIFQNLWGAQEDCELSKGH